MMATLKSDLRKLLTVRSTYIMTALAMSLVILFAWFGTSPQTIYYDEIVCESTGEVLHTTELSDFSMEGDRAPSYEELEAQCGGPVISRNKTETSNDLPKDKLLFSMQEVVPVIVTFASVVVILFMAHEFRYNTINYTLTLSNRRSKVLLSKLIVTVLFTIFITLLAIGVSIAVTQAAINVKDLTLPAQDYNWSYIMLRHLGYALAYTLFGLGVITLVRNLTAGIAAIFVLPVIDSIGGYLLLANFGFQPTKILPFSALDRFGNVVADVTGNNMYSMENYVDSGATSEPATMLFAGGVLLAYLAGLWIITWIVFIRRDAN